MLLLLHRSVSVSAGVCALFTYATYATLPLRLHEATIGGLVLAAVNIGAHMILVDTSDWEVSRPFTISC